MPVIQMAGMLLNNILYYFDIYNELSYTFDFIIGNSIVTTILLYVCSNVFHFCIWHKTIIIGNFINLIIANIDSIFYIPISDIQLLIIYHIIAAIFVIIATILHIKRCYEKCKNKYNKKTSRRSYCKY